MGKSYFYTRDFLDYTCTRSGYSDNSYIYEDNEHYFNAPITHKDNRVEAGFLSYLPLPFYCGVRKSKYVRKLMKEYLQCINKLGPNRIALRQDPCVEYYDVIIKELLADGFVPNMFYTTIVDLHMNEELLWQRERASARSLINSVKNNPKYRLIVVTSDNVANYLSDWADLYRQLVMRGGVTLSDDVFATVSQSISNNHTYIYLLYNENQLISGAQIDVGDDFAYYSAAGIKPEFESSGSYMHYLLWNAILDLKQKNLSKLEIGPAFFRDMINFYAPSEKELSISHFKLGVGGELTPFIIFIKE